MAILSSLTLVKIISLLHFTFAYYLMVAPRVLVDQNLVWVLGEAMGLQQVSAFNKTSPVTGLLALVFVLLGLSDFTAASMNEEVALAYWSAQTPVRLLFLFGVSGYPYLFKKGGLFGAKGLTYTPGAGDNLKNSVVFAWGFLEISAWFWVYASLKEERRQAAIRIQERKKREENML